MAKQVSISESETYGILLGSSLFLMGSQARAALNLNHPLRLRHRATEEACKSRGYYDALGMNHSLLEEDLTKEIIGAAIEVHRYWGPGLMESIYEKSLAVELEK